jgi:hypothetical protein
MYRDVLVCSVGIGSVVKPTDKQEMGMRSISPSPNYATTLHVCVSLCYSVFQEMLYGISTGFGSPQVPVAELLARAVPTLHSPQKPKSSNFLQVPDIESPRYVTVVHPCNHCTPSLMCAHFEMHFTCVTADTGTNSKNARWAGH